MEKPIVFVFTTAYAPLIGGAEIAIEEVVRRLHDRFDFYIFTHRTDRMLPAREAYGGATIFRVGFGTKFDQMFLFPFLVFLKARRVAAGRRAVLWAVMVSYASIAAFFLKSFDARHSFVLTLQEGDSEDHVARGRFGMIRFWWSRMLKKADRVTAISTYLAERAGTFGRRNATEVIPNGVDVERFQNLQTKTYGLTSKTIITTSRLVRKNGIDILIDAIVEVKKSIPDVRCLIIGDGPERANLQLQTTNYKLQTYIKFLGSIPHEQIPGYLHQADIFVRPSRSEGMGNSFVGALAAGLPIIGTPVGGITDIIEDGKTGLFAAVDNPHDLAEKILRVLSDSDLAERIVKNGQAMVRKRFSWDGIAESYSHLFDMFQTKSGTRCARLSLEQPRVLMLSADPHILIPGSEARERMESYARVLGRLEIVIPTKQIIADSAEKNLFLYPASGTSSVKQRITMYRIARRLCRSGVFDVITAQGPDEIGFIAAFLAHQYRIPFQLQMHTDVFSPYYRSAGWKERVRYCIARFLIPRADRIRVVSERIKNSILRKSDFLREVRLPEITVLSIYTDVSKFLSAPRDSETDARFKDYTFKMISVGRFVDKEKNFSMLIEMMREFVKIYSQALLVIVGYGPDGKSYASRIMKYGLQRNVILEPSRDDLPSFLKSFDLFVSSSNYEGWGRAMIEAMASGLSVVMTDVGLAGEVVKNGENGIVVPVGDKSAFLKACTDLYRDSIKRATLARAGTETVKNLSPHSREEYLKRYRESF